MKILLLPFILTIAPPFLLFLFLYYYKKSRTFSKAGRIILGVLFGSIGILTTMYATLLSVQGIAENGVRCATGAATFLYLGFVLNFAGIPLLLALYRNSSKRINQNG